MKTLARFFFLSLFTLVFFIQNPVVESAAHADIVTCSYGVSSGDKAGINFLRKLAQEGANACFDAGGTCSECEKQVTCTDGTVETFKPQERGCS